jgi:RNA polymerase sigma-70 factor (ECF subfamily)
VSTDKSLLIRAKNGSSHAWEQLCTLYKGFIFRWLAHCGLIETDAEDLCQEILLKLVGDLERFEHNGRTGAFRAWLRALTVTQFRQFCRDRQRNVLLRVEGGISEIDHHEDPASELSARWEQEHDVHVLSGLLDCVAREFRSGPMEAFRRLVLEGQSGDQIAADLGMSRGAVYVAKFRISKRLRELAEGLVD